MLVTVLNANAELLQLSYLASITVSIAMSRVLCTACSTFIAQMMHPQVEDWTGKGRQDLEAGLIRTPLPASETFMDGEIEFLLSGWLHSFMGISVGLRQSRTHVLTPFHHA